MTLAPCFLSFVLGVWGPLRYRELHAVEERLRAMPGVTRVRTWGNEDVTFEDLGAVVQAHGSGTVTFFDLTEEDFEDAEQLHVGELGSRVRCARPGRAASKNATGPGIHRAPERRSLVSCWQGLSRRHGFGPRRCPPPAGPTRRRKERSFRQDLPTGWG
ncbi:hypothetical protein [Pyxidicoccus xibeiensis]|uniref:hypothetical protein n=1 Tax=Pyxidicoccus xibeiensis TaxID=2906759 RepID=UPI0020A7CC82|nr:hypothetical protein [Pyxidicoccus xibeiensis]MCP3135986.1 hypothetical protein [Pyxidicoccus xibeiensis]